MPRTQRKRTGNVDALSLPAGEFVRMPPKRRLVEANFAQQLYRASVQARSTVARSRGSLRADSSIAAMNRPRLGQDIQHVHSRI